MAAEHRTLSGRIFSASGPTAGARLAFSIVDDRGRPAMAASGIPGLVLMGTVGDVETDVDGAFSVDVIPTVGRNFRYMLELTVPGGQPPRSVLLLDMPDAPATLDELLPVASRCA